MRAGVVVGVVGVLVGVAGCSSHSERCEIGEIYLSREDESEPVFGEAIWEVEIIAAPGARAARHELLCRDLATTPGEDGGTGALVQESETTVLSCYTIDWIGVGAWPYAVRVRTRETSGLWNFDDWVEVRLSPAPVGNKCWVWKLEFDRSGRVIEQIPHAEDDAVQGGDE
jgi:hypothetical protein